MLGERPGRAGLTRAVHPRRQAESRVGKDRHSDDVGEGDAIEVAAKLRSLRAESSTG
jgi:hypothetical protein